MKHIILVTLILLTFPTDALCCSCYGKRRVTVEDFNSHDAIFIGKLIQESRSDTGDYKFRRKCVYKIVILYKGTFTGDTISIFDAEDIAACGLGRMTVGRDYLLYAYGSKKMITNSCMRTTLVPLLSLTRDMETINKLINLNSFERLYDTAGTNFYADTIFLNKHLTNVSKNGSQKFYDKDGNISAEGCYVQGIPQGFWKYYKSIGVTQGKYINRRKDSLWTEPYSKEMLYVREYRLGEYTCKQTRFYDGRISSKTEPADKDDKWIDYDFHPNGQVRFIAYANPPQKGADGYLEHPVWDGPFKTFNKNGILLKTGVHKGGS